MKQPEPPADTYNVESLQGGSTVTATLSLFSAAESAVESLIESGRPVVAVQMLRRLLARPDAIGETGCRLHQLAADCLVQLSRFSAARKHLLLAHRCHPNDASVAFQLGERYERDDGGNPEKSAKWFSRARKRDPRNPLYLASFGLAAIRIGKRKIGWACIVEAVEICPGSPAILSLAVDACRMVNKLELARRWVLIGRFLSSDRNAMDQIWEQIRFDRACATHGRRTTGRSAPHLRIVGDDASAVREDRPSAESKPHFLKLMSLTGR